VTHADADRNPGLNAVPVRASTTRRGSIQLVLDALRHEGPASQATLARRARLSPATVNNIVKALQAQGIAEVQSVNGRESLVTLVAGRGSAVVVEVTIASVRAALFNFDGHVRYDASAACAPEPGADGGDPGLAMDVVRSLTAQAGVSAADLTGIAVSVQAPVARATGTVTSWARSQLPGWAGVPIEEVFARQFAVPVVAENDANLAALAEWTWGAGRGAAEFLYVMCSSGVGGGLIIDGRIYRGGDGLAGEIGHMVVDPNGPVCFCGSRGCLTMFTSERSILAALESSGGAPRSLPDVIESAGRGDPACRLVLREAGRYLGRALANAAKVMAPSVIAVGGVLAEAGPLVFDSLRSSAEVHSLHVVSPSVEFRPAQFKADASLFGGLAAVLVRAGQGASVLPAWA
jgi:predicted NBD/HSP70 family sugar kinase/predicted transcriptional regulator